MTETVPQPRGEQSPTRFEELLQQRQEAEQRGRAGSKAIAAAAFRALQEGQLTRQEYEQLFPLPEDQLVPAPRQAADDEEPETREPDWMERAAGEAVRHPWDDK